MTPSIVLDFPLDARGSTDTRQPLAFGAPREILHAGRHEEVRAVLRAAEAHARDGAWVIGFVAYDAAPAFDAALRIPGRQADLPLAWFAVFDTPLAEASLPPPADRVPDDWRPGIDRAHFDADIARLRQAIYDGATYQVNHTLRLHANGIHGPDAPTALAWFARLRRAQPQGYCAYLDLGTQRILSVSPELFFRRDGDVIVARPMKGTARRGRWPAEDRHMAEWLAHSEKNRAENLMIVDLLRNDLSRIAQPHSVRVSDLFAVERHPTVWQMTSTVHAQVRPGTTLEDLFAALFPCGSVTGAPKAKAMELIAATENAPRGIYCGAIGLLKPGGDALFNVAIRTVSLAEGHATCGIGGGITWSSTAGEEYDEALLKARFLEPGAAAVATETADFDLLETLRLEDGGYARLERHLARLAGSADYFGFVCDPANHRRQLLDIARQHAQGLWRVRLTLAANGTCEIRATPMPATSVPPPAPPTFTLAATPVERDNLWLHHKTTRRALYDAALATKPDAEIFDVLLGNTAGELTEFTRGNLVLEIDGRRYTPPLDCGLLDGTLRRELLESGHIEERVLTQHDLARARRILFINSLRGEIEIRWHRT